MKATLRLALTTILLVTMLGAAQVQAQPTVVCGTDDPIFGTAANFSLQGGYMGWMVTSTKWEHQWIVGGCNTGFVFDQNGANSVAYQLLYPGTLKVKCTVMYNNGLRDQTMTFIPDKTITVPPPDGLAIASGNKVSAKFGQNNRVYSTVTGPIL